MAKHKAMEARKVNALMLLLAYRSDIKPATITITVTKKRKEKKKKVRQREKDREREREKKNL